MSVDYYNRYTTDILTAVPVSQTFGLPAPIVNAGAMRNKGVEFLLNHRNNLNGLSYDVSFNMAVNDNNVEIFPNPVMGATIRAEGYAWDSFYGYEVLGIFQSDAEAADSPILPGSPAGAGDFRYKDQNGDGVINGLDRVDLGSSIPRITYGVNLNLSYKQFDISAFLQGADKVYRTLGAWAMWPLGNNYGNPSRMHLDRTIVDNGVVVQQGRYPRILMSQGHNRAMSSFQVLDASYLRVRNLQIGYTFSSDLLNRINVSRARVYLNGQNLFTISDFPDGFDPEVANGRADYYPQVKFYTMGVDITF